MQTLKKLFFAEICCKFLTFLGFLQQKTLKMTISTSVWRVQHPNAGQNIQHRGHFICSKYVPKRSKITKRSKMPMPNNLIIFYVPKIANLDYFNFGLILSSQVQQLYYNTNRCRTEEIRPSPLSICRQKKIKYAWCCSWMTYNLFCF